MANRLAVMGDPPASAAPKPCCVCDEPGGKHCTKCKSRHYCSKACQLIDWYERGHKAQCKQLAAEFQDRLLDELLPKRLKIKEEPVIVEDVAPAAGSEAAPRLSAARATALVKPRALDDATPGYRRGTCAICLNVLPFEADKQLFYTCCCNSICSACSDKCGEYDTRCPLCRASRAVSHAETLSRLQKHVDEGNVSAQLQLGNMYRDGHTGLKQNSKRAGELYKLAAAQGHAPAQFTLGCYYIEREGGDQMDLVAAAHSFRRAADQGLSKAQSNLGHMTYNGKGVAQSYYEAVRWYRLAAAQGDACALANLGACYVKGHGVPQDFDEALRLYKRAAALGAAGAAAIVERAAARLAEARAL